MPLNFLNQGTPTLASSVPFGDTSSGFDRRCSVADIFALLTPPSGLDGFATQYSAPNATGYITTVVAPATGLLGTWLLMTPVADYAVGTIILPIGKDGIEVLVSSTHALTALTVTGASVGAAAQPVNGAPTALAVNGFFRLRFDGVNNSWFRIG